MRVVVWVAGPSPEGTVTGIVDAVDVVDLEAELPADDDASDAGTDNAAGAAAGAASGCATVDAQAATIAIVATASSCRTRRRALNTIISSDDSNRH